VGLDAPPVEATAVTVINTPNILSISRILSVPVFIILMIDPTPVRAFIAGLVFSAASRWAIS
jgi:phosphatidylglycerophosphate synthase